MTDSSLDTKFLPVLQRVMPLSKRGHRVAAVHGKPYLVAVVSYQHNRSSRREGSIDGIPVAV